jgi:hypothetical protein
MVCIATAYVISRFLYAVIACLITAEVTALGMMKFYISNSLPLLPNMKLIKINDFLGVLLSKYWISVVDQIELLLS